jgi:transcriptional regulator with XRE-family HTH domain
MTTDVVSTNQTPLFVEGRGDMGRTPALTRTDRLDPPAGPRRSLATRAGPSARASLLPDLAVEQDADEHEEHAESQQIQDDGNHGRSGRSGRPGRLFHAAQAPVPVARRRPRRVEYHERGAAARCRGGAPDANMTPWGSALKQQLELRGMSQHELARLAGLDPGTVSHLLRGGHCSTGTLQKVAAALDIALPELFLPPGVTVAAEDVQDRLVAALLRELSDEVGEAVTQRLHRRRTATRLPGETPLPFGD